MVSRRGAAPLLGGLYAIGAVCNSPAGEVFTVRDSIEMTHLSDPDDTDPSASTRFNFSPDRRYFTVVKRKGDVARNSITYSLEAYDIAQLHSAVLNPSSDLPHGRVLASFETESPRKAIEQVRWSTDSGTVTFIGRSQSGSGSGYAARIDGSLLRKITPDQYDVLTFDYIPVCEHVLFVHESPPKWENRKSGGYVVGPQQMAYLAKRSPLEARPSISFRLRDLRTHNELEVRLTKDLESWWGFPPARPVLSPDCSRAIIHTGIADIPDRWLQYDLSGNYQATTAVDVGVDTTFAGLAHNEAFGRPAPWIGQFHVVDLKTGGGRPLLDAPTGWSFAAPQAQWLKDGSGVIVGPTYLPSNTKITSTRTQVIAQVDLRSGKVRNIAPVVTGGIRNPNSWVTGFSINSAGDLIVESQDASNASATAIKYSLHNGTWSQARQRKAAASATEQPLQLTIEQGMNTPPEIVGVDSRTGTRRALTSLNPQLRELRFGKVREFRWSDRLQRTFTGGLVFPPDHRSDKRYPLVVQTYGFNPRQFLVDGARDQTTAYAAQALAGRGLLVLQMPGTDADPKEDSSNHGRWGENTKFQVALEGALDALNVRGLIEPSRVGLIGFSREGMHVEHFVTFSTYPIVAATISDSVAASPFCYAQMFGQPYPGMVDIENENVIGAPFWGAGIELWMKRSYIFHLDQIRAAIRFEHIGTDFVPCHWDAYALLKRHERPVEMIHIPFDEHSLQTPAGRLASQAGNVDWFDFWLNGDSERGANPESARWKRLRERRDRLFL